MDAPKWTKTTQWELDGNQGAQAIIVQRGTRSPEVVFDSSPRVITSAHMRLIYLKLQEIEEA